MAAVYVAGLLANWMVADVSLRQGLPQLSLLIFAALCATGVSLFGSRSWGLYHPVREFRAQWLSVLLTTTVMLIGDVVMAVSPRPGFIAALLLTSAMSLVLMPVLATLVRLWATRQRWWGQRVVLLGTDQSSEAICRWLMANPDRGLLVVGVVGDLDASAGQMPVPCLGPLEKLGWIAEQCAVQVAVVSDHRLDEEPIASLVRGTGHRMRDWIYVSEFADCPALWTTAGEIGSRPALHVANRLARVEWRFLKRSFDLLAGLILLMLCMPLLLIAAALIRLTSRGPILFQQRRLGYRGRMFVAWKLRTMRADAEAYLQRYLNEHPELRAEWDEKYKLPHDPRVTLLGRVLRRTCIDELPQLWNVVKGEMSLVGPRPMLAEEIDRYRRHQLDYVEYTRVRPGLTGLWQVLRTPTTTYDDRVHYNSYYVRNWCIWLDAYLLARTFHTLLFGNGLS
jgi:Undecaprenyl-phosphate galactose phosphotransferase WbaP